MVSKSILTVLFLTIGYILFSASTNSLDYNPENEEITVDSNCISGQLFNEKDGIVRVDIENSNTTDTNWSTENTRAGFEGSGYLVWTGTDNFNTPDIGTMKFSIKITNPGTYQFVWSSRITEGTRISEHNDSWLRIATASDFYGEKANTGERVYPKGTGKTPNPEGTSANGWFKIYMNKVGEWVWKSSTNDKDSFDVFVKFDTPGIYDIEISGRSKNHAIDQFVLFKTDQSLTAAQNAVMSEIPCQ